MATGSFQTLRLATVYMFPFAAHEDLGAEAVTQFGQTGQGLVPSLMDGRSALAWPALPAPSSTACEYTLCAVNNATTHPQGRARSWHLCASPAISTEYPNLKYLLCTETTLRAPEHFEKLRHLLCAPTSTWCMDHVRQSGSPKPGRRTKPALLNWPRCRRWEALFLI